jgi:DNA-binding transcriptional MerR regulator
MSIGEVLETLEPEFPGLTISKLRYLEEQGLVRPSRTDSGFRRYVAEDLDRVRYVLTEQRDRFLPLKVIRARLAVLDQGLGGYLPSAGPRELRSAQVEPGEVATVTGQPPALIEAVAKAAGVPATGPAGAALVQAVEAVADLASQGLELRHLRMVFQAANREADLVEALATAMRSHGSAGQERARTVALDAAEAISRLGEAALRLALDHRGL